MSQPRQHAAELTGDAIAHHEPVAATHGNFGMAPLRPGRLDAALACLERAIALEPRFAAVHGNRGIALLDAGRLNTRRRKG